MITQDERIKITIREMKALGQTWRNDWSDFDGRTLRYQLELLANFLGSTDPESEDAEDFTAYSTELKIQEEEFGA